MSSVIGRPHPWGALDSDDYTGIELWSLETEAAEGWRSLREAIAFMRDPESALKGPSQRNLAAWDELCERRRVVGIGGLDAHETGLRVGRRVLSPFPNGRFFRFLRTHVLVEEPLTGRLEPDRAAVYGALSEGRCFLAMDAIADGRGFTFHAEAARGRKLEMGAEAEAGAEWVMEARSPRRAELRLLTGGAELARAAEAFTLRCRISTPGAYRVEAWRERRRWIVSNPIYLRADGGSAHADGSGHEP